MRSTGLDIQQLVELFDCQSQRIVQGRLLVGVDVESEHLVVYQSVSREYKTDIKESLYCALHI